MLTYILFFVLGVYSQLTYYVASAGSDGTSCGTQSAPCATINQIFINYPGASFTVSIGAGTYLTTSISLEKDALVIFQGTDNPTISALWLWGDTFIVNSPTSGFEFRDLSIAFSDLGDGDAFTKSNGPENYVGFYNVNLALMFNGNFGGRFINMDSGSLVISNMTISNSDFGGYFIVDATENDGSNITITESTFTNMSFGESGALLSVVAWGAGSVIINGSTFADVSVRQKFIGIWAMDSKISVTNNVFNNTYGYEPAVYLENDKQCVISVTNTTWNNASAETVCGALEILGSGARDGIDHDIILDNLKFSNCSGTNAGALLIAYNSLNASGLVFSNNTGEEVNDLMQYLESYTSNFGCVITNSYSSSALPKAEIYNGYTQSSVDISDLLPDPSSSSKTIIPLHPLIVKTKPVSPKPIVDQKFRKN